MYYLLFCYKCIIYCDVINVLFIVMFDRVNQLKLSLSSATFVAGCCVYLI